MKLHIGDPRFDSWEVVQRFGDVETAQAFAQQLADAAFDIAVTADHQPDSLGRGDIYLCVPPQQALEAEDFIGSALEELEGY